MKQIFFDETFVLICFSFTFSLPTKEAKSEFVLRIRTYSARELQEDQDLQAKTRAF
jgi:hypothetical protein